MGKKLIVPQELQSKIIDAYVNDLKGIRVIKKDLQLSYSPQKIREVLVENNIHIRDTNEANNLKRKYKINDNYDFNNHNGAWILGMIASDGYLPLTSGACHKIVLTLQRRDEDVLELIKNELEFTGPIYQYESSNGYDCSSLSFTSRELRSKIESFGITNAKSFTFSHIPKNLSEEYIIDFIRGYFDGDGSVYGIEKEKKIGMSFTSGNRQILEEITQFLASSYRVAVPTIHEEKRVHTIYEVHYYKKDSITLGDIFYDNDYISLPRKKNHFFELKEKFPIVRE